MVKGLSLLSPRTCSVAGGRGSIGTRSTRLAMRIVFGTIPLYVLANCGLPVRGLAYVYTVGFLNLLFAATSSACKVASAPPRLCPQTVREFTCLLPKMVASDAVTDGPLVPPIVNDLYISFNPPSLSPAPSSHAHAARRTP